MQALPGAARTLDGAPLEVPASTQALVITALPDGPNDPDARTDDRYPAPLIRRR